MEIKRTPGVQKKPSLVTARACVLIFLRFLRRLKIYYLATECSLVSEGLLTAYLIFNRLPLMCKLFGLPDLYEMVATLLTLCCGILSLNSWLFNFIFDSKYYAGHLYAPVLIGGTVFATISQFYGSIQISLKQPKENGITTVIGAAANVVIHLALIRFIGLYAAAISTILSEIIVCILRRQRLAKFVTLTLSGQSICYFAVYLVFTGLAYYITNPIVNVVSVIAATIIVVYANKNFILKFVRKLKTK